MVFKKQENPKGNYKDHNGVRFDVLTCERTESKEWYNTGQIDSNGAPIFESRIAVNKGWDEFADKDAAVLGYGLTFEPLPDGVNL